MSLSQAVYAMVESEVLRQENEVLKERISRLSEASIGISEGLDTEASSRKSSSELESSPAPGAVSLWSPTLRQAFATSLPSASLPTSRQVLCSRSRV